MSNTGPRWWPPHRVPDPGERVEMSCAGCGLAWWIHDGLRGSRMRCECGTWLVPSTAQPRAIAATPRTQSAVETVPSTMGSSSLTHADADTRRRWTDRTILELAAMMAAFLGPAMLLHACAAGRRQALLMPLADLASGILILLVGAAAGTLAFGGLRRAAAVHFFEAIAVAGGAVALAVGWSEVLAHAGVTADGWLGVLRDELGLPWTLFVVGLCPAIFEELAFRGLLQARLTVLLGTRLGIVVTGTAFALAHGVTLAFPLHMLLGLHLCWLRQRSGSLLPGMVQHFAYNAAVVLAM